MVSRKVKQRHQRNRNSKTERKRDSRERTLLGGRNRRKTAGYEWGWSSAPPAWPEKNNFEQGGKDRAGKLRETSEAEGGISPAKVGGGRNPPLPESPTVFCLKRDTVEKKGNGHQAQHLRKFRSMEGIRPHSENFHHTEFPKLLNVNGVGGQSGQSGLFGGESWRFWGRKRKTPGGICKVCTNTSTLDEKNGAAKHC